MHNNGLSRHKQNTAINKPYGNETKQQQNENFKTKIRAFTDVYHKRCIWYWYLTTLNIRLTCD